jgi:tetratricopeptide (TPR) repeat protein
MSGVRFRDRLSVTRVALVLIIAFGAFTSFFRLGAHGFWFDEITGARVADLRDSADVVEAEMDSHPPAMALAEHWFRRAFGLSEWSLRAPAALASVLALFFVFAFATALGDARVGCLAAGLAAASPVFVFFAHNARPYALAMFCGAAASACLLFAFRNRRLYVWFPLYAVFAALALYTHYFTTLLLAAHLLVGLLAWVPALRPPAARAARRYALLFGLLVLALAAAAAAVWPIFAKAAADRARFPGGEMAITPSLLWGAFAGAAWDRAAAPVLFLVAVAAGVTFLWRRRGGFAGIAALALVVLPAYLPVVVVRFTTQYWNPRFSYFAFPAVASVAAYGFVAIGGATAAASRRRLGAAVLVLVLAAGAARAAVDGVVALRVQYTTAVQDFRGAVALVNRNRNWQTKALVWPFRNWDCYHFYTKTQGGPNAVAKPRVAIYETIETWPRVFLISTDGELSEDVLARYGYAVKFRLQGVDVIYSDPTYVEPARVYARLPGDVIGVPPAVMMNALGRRALRNGQPNRAVSFFEEAIAAEGPAKAEIFVLANLWAERGQCDRALALVGGYIERYPNEGWPYTRLAEIYIKKGDKNSAIACYRRAIWLEPAKENWRERLSEMVSDRPFFRGLFGYSDPRWM